MTDAAPPDAPSPDTPPPDTGTDTTDLAAELEKWKAQARKHEERAKANANAAKELDKLRQASMSDIEKAVDIARKEATAEALRTVGARLVDAEVRVAAADRAVDVDALLEGLDRSRFVSDDGEPDRKAIAAWIDRVAPKPDPSNGRFPDLGQGARNGGAGNALNGDPLLRAVETKIGIR